MIEKNQILTGFFFFILISTAMTQSVRATVDSSEVYSGQTFEFRIVIEGSTDSAVPDLPEIDGITTAYRGASTTMVSSFGTGGNNSTRTVTHSWSFTPLKTGRLAIPSVAVDVQGNTFYTKPGIITVKSPEPLEGFHLIVESDKGEYWEGEPVYLTIKWLISPGIKVSSPLFTIPFINNGRFSAQSQDPPQGSDIYKIDIAGMEVLIMQAAEILEGKQYTSLSFRLKLMTEDVGDFALEPITLAFDTSERTTSLRTRYTTKVIPSNSLAFSIRELPEDAPDNIILAPGKLEIKSSAEPTRVHVGDPLTYSIEIRGALVPENVTVPPLGSYRNLEENFTIPERRSTGKIDGDSVIFSQTIRVKNEQQKSIPSNMIPYFNTGTGLVEEAWIPEIAMEVLETQVVTSADLESTGYRKNPVNQNRGNLTENTAGLMVNFPLEKMIRPSDGSYFLWLFLIILSPLIFISLLIIKRKSQLFPERRNDFDRIYNDLQNSDIQSIYKGINRYLHLILEKENMNLTPREIHILLIGRGNESEICDQIESCLEQLEKALYSSDNRIDGTQILSEFNRLSREIV
ncbi:MAG: hypothetical protein EH225_04080 [Calditrichaeota bacterium]|nr:MAG: hypothetical protein EH225_04080 [Calditrichota bacterium]